MKDNFITKMIKKHNVPYIELAANVINNVIIFNTYEDADNRCKTTDIIQKTPKNGRVVYIIKDTIANRYVCKHPLQYLEGYIVQYDSFDKAVKKSCPEDKKILRLDHYSAPYTIIGANGLPYIKNCSGVIMERLLNEDPKYIDMVPLDMFSREHIQDMQTAIKKSYNWVISQLDISDIEYNKKLYKVLETYKHISSRAQQRAEEYYKKNQKTIKAKQELDSHNAKILEQTEKMIYDLINNIPNNIK